MNKKINITMATYLGAHNLKNISIPSIINQTLTNWTLYVVGDGTTDDTQDIIKSFDDSRIVYTNIDRPDYNKIVGNTDSTIGSKFWNVAGVYALNKAIEQCNDGEYIAHLDQDDFWMPNHLEVLYNSAENRKLDFVYSGIELFCKNHFHSIQARAFNKLSLINNGNFIYHSSVMYRASVFGKCKYPDDINLPVDYQMWASMAKQYDGEFYLISQNTVLYFQRCTIDFAKNIIKDRLK